jgi:Uma2 family endonuclease
VIGDILVMRPAPVLAGVSLQDYLEFERSSSLRHEYANGEIFAMSSGPLEHSGVVANIIGELGKASLGAGCRVLTSDMRIKVLATCRYLYPDVSVVCARPELEDDHRDTLLNPRVIVEVLSEASEAYDRGDKFAQYRTISSLEEYVLASQKERRLR